MNITLRSRLWRALYIILLFSGMSSLYSQSQNNILILFSYHPGNEWEDSIYTTLIQGLKEKVPGSNLYVEFMDTKRYSPAEQFPLIFSRLERMNREDLSLIITVDDNALNYMIDNRDVQFPDVPVVFCGVNRTEKISSHLPEKFTGVFSSYNLGYTLEFSQKLLPGLTTYYVIADSTITGRAEEELIQDQIDNLSGTYGALDFEFAPTDVTTEELLAWTETLLQGSALILTNWHRDAAGEYIGKMPFIQKLQEHTAVPVFNIHQKLPGVLGGNVNTGSVQAESVLRMAFQILDGKDTSLIPFKVQEGGEYYVDYNRIRNWNIRSSHLPEGTVVLNPSFLYQYKTIVIYVLLIFVLLIFFLMLSGRLIFRLRKTGSDLALQKNELFTTLSSIGDGVISTDRLGNIKFLNSVAEKMTGWSLDEAQGRELKDVFRIVNMYSRKPVANPVQKVLLSGQTVELANHTVLISREGLEYHIADSAAPIRENGSDLILGVVLVFRDVSEAYRMKKILSDEQRRLDDAQAMAMVANWEYYPETGSYWFSNEVYTLFGLDFKDEKEYLNLDFMKEIFPGWNCEDPLPFGMGGKRHSGITRYQKNYESRMAFFHVSARMIILPESRKQIVTGIVQDVSELFHAREALKASREQLRQAARMEAVGKLAGGIAHEFNNLLQVIMGYSQLIKEEYTDNRARTLIDPILHTASSARNLTKQLLLFSRKETSIKSYLSLSELMKSLFPILTRFLEAEISLESDIEGKDDTIFGDRQQIEQIIMNLSLNARDAMGGKGVLKISQDLFQSSSFLQSLEGEIPPGDYVHLTVQDTGHGIPEHILPEIFDPFFTTKELETGTGLGLSIVYGIIKQHDGYIRIETEASHGTVFHLYFPQSREIPENLSENLNYLAEERSFEGTVYLAEDDPMVRELVETLIQDMGFRIKSFVNGRDLVEYLDYFNSSKADVDLFLLDVVMPEMGGEEVYRRIRENGYKQPILFASGYTRERLGDLSKLENSRLIHKPFSKKELSYHIREMISG